MAKNKSQADSVYWQVFSINENGEAYSGKFCLEGNYIKVSSALGTKTARMLASNSPIVADQSGLAEMLLRELIQESKMHG